MELVRKQGTIFYSRTEINFNYSHKLHSICCHLNLSIAHEDTISVKTNTKLRPGKPVVYAVSMWLVFLAIYLLLVFAVLAG